MWDHNQQTDWEPASSRCLPRPSQMQAPGRALPGLQSRRPWARGFATGGALRLPPKVLGPCPAPQQSLRASRQPSAHRPGPALGPPLQVKRRPSFIRTVRDLPDESPDQNSNNNNKTEKPRNPEGTEIMQRPEETGAKPSLMHLGGQTLSQEAKDSMLSGAERRLGFCVVTPENKHSPERLKTGEKSFVQNKPGSTRISIIKVPARKNREKRNSQRVIVKMF